MAGSVPFSNTWRTIPNWQQRATHWDFLHSVLTWSDESGDYLEAASNNQGIFDGVYNAKNVQYGGVYRAHRMQLLTGAIAHKDEVEVVSWVSRVALRSYDLTHEMRRASDQTVLAYITSTRVMILDGRAAPLPHYDRLKQIVQPIETKTACESVTSPRPANAFVLPMLVRQSDVDTQGHINNAKYMFLMEDAKNAAVQSGALPKAYAKLSTAEVYIQYNAEVKPHQVINIYIWAEDEDATTKTPSVSYEFVSDPSAPSPVVATRIRTSLAHLKSAQHLRKHYSML